MLNPPSLSPASLLDLKKLILYTTRPVRDGEKDGVQYYFTDERRLQEFETAGKVIESRAYNTVYGIWTYFTADDGQIDLKNGNYLGIGTLESFQKMLLRKRIRHTCLY